MASDINEYKHPVDSDFRKDALWCTGYFRDGIRRVDLVLVFKSMGSYVDALQISYLMSLLDMGIDVEVERAVMIAHDDLVFVKLHAPTLLLEKYGTYFGLRKFFKFSHLQYVEEGVPAEIDLIRITQKQHPSPGFYNTMERTSILHRVLCNQPAEGKATLFNLNNLLRERTVWDVFPLHDGPYFMLPMQGEETVTARQALFYSWVGRFNMTKCHPMNLIREYYGERIAFIYGFWESLIKYQFALGCLQVTSFIISMTHYNARYKEINDGACKSNYTYTYQLQLGNVTSKPIRVKDLPICPKCKDFDACPIRKLTQYCVEVQFKNKLDEPTVACSAMFGIILGWLLFFEWWKREEYLMWLWEVPRDSSRNSTRKDYVTLEPTFPPMGRNFAATFFRIAIMTMYLILLFLTAMVPVGVWFHTEMLRRTRFLDKDVDFVSRCYVILIVVGVMNALMIFILTRPSRWLAYMLTKMGNHRTDEAFERSLMVKRICFSFVINFTLFYFYAVIKNSYYTYPSDTANWNRKLGLGMMNCGLLNCLDELFLVMLGTGTVGKAVLELFFALRFAYQFYEQIKRTPTDYGGWFMANVPSWEREYRLEPFTETNILDLLLHLVLIHAKCTFFMSVVPFIPILSAVIQLWEIRAHVDNLMLCRRRPLLTKTHGVGIWRWALVVVPVLAGFSNAIIFARNSSVFDRLMHREKFHQHSFFGEYALSYFNISDFKQFESNKKINYGADFCMFTGKYVYDLPRIVQTHRYIPEDTVFYNSYTESSLKFYIELQQETFIIIYVSLTLLGGAVVWRLMWSETESADMQEMRAVEEAVRDFTLELERVKKDT